MSSPRLPGSPAATCSPMATYCWDQVSHWYQATRRCNSRRLLPGGVMEWGLRFFLMKSQPLPIPIMKRAPDIMDRDALQPCQPREHTSSGVDATRTQWQPQRDHTRRKVQRNACSCFFLSLPSCRRRDVLVCPCVNSERSAAGPLALPAAPRRGGDRKEFRRRCRRRWRRGSSHWPFLGSAFRAIG